MSKPASETNFLIGSRSVSHTSFVENVVRRFQMIFIHKLTVVFADQFFLAEPEQTLNPVVDKSEAAVPIKHIHQVG